MAKVMDPFYQADIAVKLITYRTSNYRNLCTGVVTLEAELHGLPRRYAVVPACTGCGVRIAAGDGRIPGAGDPGAARVSPADVPVVDGAGAFIGDADRAGKA